MPEMTNVAWKNLKTVSQIEDTILKPSHKDQLVESLISQVGSLPCVAAHFMFFAGWLIFNSGWLKFQAFDPYPFSFLGMLVAVEAIFLTLAVLMNQKRQNQHGRLWEHLNLQINLLTEQEMTKVLQVLEGVADRVGVQRSRPDAEMNEMIQETPIEMLAEEVGKRNESKPAP